VNEGFSNEFIELGRHGRLKEGRITSNLVFDELTIWLALRRELISKRQDGLFSIATAINQKEDRSA